jgi:hypothetical protein
MENYTFSIPSDQYDNISNGYLLIEKTLENYQNWYNLRLDDSIFVAPVVVPFRIYHVKVHSIGIVDGNERSKNGGGLIVYVKTATYGDKIKTNLYNLNVFSKSCSISENEAFELSPMCNSKIDIAHRNKPRDVLPISLPSGYQLKVISNNYEDQLVRNLAEKHTFGESTNGLCLLLWKEKKLVGAAVIRPNQIGRRKHRAESRIFGPELIHIRDYSVYIDRTFSEYNGISKHRIYYLLYIAILQLSRSMFIYPTSYICGASYDLLPAAQKAGFRVELPENESESVFYWKSFGSRTSEPHSAIEYKKIKTTYRNYLKSRRMSSSWFCFNKIEIIVKSLELGMWLISDHKHQRAKWSSINYGDRIFLADLNGDLIAVAAVERTSKRKIRGYERYPLAIEFSSSYRCTVEEKVAFSKIMSWLKKIHVGGISSIPEEISLHLVNELRIRRNDDLMYVQPNRLLLPGTNYEIKKKHVFVVQAWSLKDSVLPVIRLICEGTGFAVTHSEDRQGMVVFADIWRLMNEAEVILVDFSDQRPNVFLEFGMALVLGKPIVVITQSKEDIPSDTPNLKWSLYEEKRALKDLRDVIPNAIAHAIEDVEESSKNNEARVF